MPDRSLKVAEKLPQMHSTTFSPEGSDKSLEIVVEWPKGSTRVGKDEDGKPWRREMKADYGYIRDVKGHDGEEQDCYICGASGNVYAIQQLEENGELDEIKLILGAGSLQEAEDLYLSHYPDDWEDDHLGEIAEISFEDLFGMIEEHKEEIQEPEAKAASDDGSIPTLEEILQTMGEDGSDLRAVESAQEVYEEVVGVLSKLPLTIYRAIRLKDISRLRADTNIDDEDEDANWEGDGGGFGVYWAWNEQGAEAYNTKADNGSQIFMFCGQLTSPNDIDWESTLYRNITTPDEYEVTLQQGTPIAITGWKIKGESQWRAPEPNFKTIFASTDPDGNTTGLRRRPDYLAEDSYCKKMNDANEKTAADITQTPGFQAWFGNSKVVDAQGNPVRVYHGTKTAGFDQFDFEDVSPTGRMYFTESPEYASEYASDDFHPARESTGNAVYPVYLSIQNPVDINRLLSYDPNNPSEYDDIGYSAKSWAAHGFDGAVGMEHDVKIWIAFRPNQIKSATGNNGSFDANNPSITASTKSKMCTCGHAMDIHIHPPDFGCPHESEGCGCVGATEVGEKTASSGYPPSLNGLAAEAKKCANFKEFKDDFGNQIKHGRYYHVTSDPNFTIDPAKGPRDMSSMAGGHMSEGKLMITSHLENWTDYYNYDENEKKKVTRPYVALIDMSQVPRKAYFQSSRGFGNEFWVEDPSKAKVIAVVPVQNALAQSKRYADLLSKYFNSNEDLEKFYNAVTGATPKVSAWSAFAKVQARFARQSMK